MVRKERERELEKSVQSLVVNASLSDGIGDVAAEKGDDVNVVFVLAEGIGGNAPHFQPSVIKKVGHGIEER